MSFKDFYNYRKEKKEKDFLEYEKSIINYNKMNAYYYDILKPCLNKISSENIGFTFKEKPRKELEILNYVFEIKLDEDEFDEFETYTLTIILEESLNNIEAKIEINIEGYHSCLKVKSIGNYLDHNIEYLEFEIKCLFIEMKDREDRQNSKG